MTNPNEIKTVCECEHALALSNENEIGEIKEDLKNISIIHEIDEEESEPEETAALEQPNTLLRQEDDKVALETNDDEDFTYTGESFYSDESCDESEITSVTLESLKSLSLLNDPQYSPKELDTKINDWKNNLQDESCSLNDRASRVATACGFVRSRRCKRWNMSFTDEEMRKIGRENELLLRKIMAQQRPRHKVIADERSTARSRLSSSAINRRKMQKKIEDDNMMLLKRIQQAKSRVFANASRMGCRLTFL